jgi:hypothetical protein
VKRSDLPDLVHKALVALGGKAPLAKVAQHIWENHETELRDSGELFYTWQYDMRWAAQKLRDAHKLQYSRDDESHPIWELV